MANSLERRGSRPSAQYPIHSSPKIDVQTTKTCSRTVTVQNQQPPEAREVLEECGRLHVAGLALLLNSERAAVVRWGCRCCIEDVSLRLRGVRRFHWRFLLCICMGILRPRSGDAHELEFKVLDFVRGEGPITEAALDGDGRRAGVV